MNIQRFLIRQLRKIGYEIRKAPPINYTSAPIFDLAVNYLMSKVGENLRFIQVGANDGVRFGDPLRKYILQFPWRGVLIEPQPEIFKQLLLNYKGQESRVDFENLAISNKSGPISIFRPFIKETPSKYGNKISKKDVEKSAIASVIPAVSARQIGAKTKELEEIKVSTITLDKMALRHESMTKSGDIPPGDTLQNGCESPKFQSAVSVRGVCH